MQNYFSGFLFIFFLLVFSCSNPSKDRCKSCELSNTDVLDSLENIMRIQKLDSLEKAAYSGLGLIDVQSINKDIFVDLKYAGKDNFMKMKLYKKLNKALLQKEVAKLSSTMVDIFTQNP